MEDVVDLADVALDVRLDLRETLFRYRRHVAVDRLVALYDHASGGGFIWGIGHIQAGSLSQVRRL
jgi:hypothetical protein